MNRARVTPKPFPVGTAPGTREPEPTTTAEGPRGRTGHAAHLRDIETPVLGRTCTFAGTERGEVTQDGAHRRVVRIGDTVRGPSQPWTPTIHALLRHLAEAGFRHAPRPPGFGGKGREVLTRIDGHPVPPDRRRRPELFCAAYGTGSTERIVDAAIARQRDTADLVRRPAEQGHEPQATRVSDGPLTRLGGRIA